MTERGPERYQFGRWLLDAKECLLLRAGEPIPLTSRVFDTLLAFVRNPGRLLDKDELMGLVWRDTTVDENNLSQNVSTLRRVLGTEPPESGYIVTVPGRGYRFTADVRPVDQGPPVAAQLPVADRGVGRDRSRAPRWIAMAILLAGVIAAGFLLFHRWRARSDEPLRTIAVLPFKPLVPERRDRALELGMADALIAKLSTLQPITVRAISAVRRFDGIEQDARAAGQELGVQAVVDGTMQRIGDRIRVSARLIRVRDEKQIWAGQFDAPLTDIFSIQDSISERVAGELALHLTSAQRGRLVRRSTEDPQAYELYLQGRFFTSLAQPLQAAAAFDQAIRRDPGFARAHAGLADIYSRLPVATDVQPHTVMSKARSAALSAIALDSELGEAHTSLAWIKFYYDWDWAGSEASYRRALELSPSDFSARLGYAHLLSSTGRHDEALRMVDEALRVDPFSPLALALKGQFLFFASRESEAIRVIQTTLERNPSFWIALIQDGRLKARSGRVEEGLAALERARHATPSNTPLAFIGFTLAGAGRRQEAERVLAELHALAARAYVPPYLLATVYAGLENREQALLWLERGYEERDVRMIFLAVDPQWEKLRSEPRFIAIMKRMNLPANASSVGSGQ